MSIKEDILKSQELRLQVLKGIYTEVKGNMENSIRSFETIEELFSNTEKTDLIGILKYFVEKNYINYIDASSLSGFDCLAITIASKGIELIEGIETDGNVSKLILKASFGDVVNSNINFGNENSQTLSIIDKDNDSILKFIDKLIDENPN